MRDQAKYCQEEGDSDESAEALRRTESLDWNLEAFISFIFTHLSFAEVFRRVQIQDQHRLGSRKPLFKN